VTADPASLARVLIDESPEIVAVIDQGGIVVACSRRARVEGIEVGQQVPERLAHARGIEVPLTAAGSTDLLVYFGTPGELASYAELRSGFTAAVSHELRTPLARLMVYLESAELPDADLPSLIELARGEVGQVTELIDEVLFLSQLETGQEIVGLGGTSTLPVLQEVTRELTDRAGRAGIALRAHGDPAIRLPLRPRLLRVIAENLIENAIRYAGEGATVTLSVTRQGNELVLTGADDGIGVGEVDLPRLFERFYRADRARSSRGTGLGLAIVKHIAGAAGGRVEARRGADGRGLQVALAFPVRPATFT
jgi:two-component system, OmpR family, phosphate regulon sensor histidine kinase PhoR